MTHKTFFSLLALTLCFCIVGCQSSEQVVSDAVKSLNLLCPFGTADHDTIEKVEYINHDVIFYVTIDETNYSLDDYTYAQLRGLESNYALRFKTMGYYLNDMHTEIAFQKVTLSNADEVDLNFKAILKGRQSNKELTFKLPWREALQIPNLRILNH